jgi:hypothetical protein
MDEGKPKNDDWKIHVFWICIVAMILFYHSRDDDAALKQFGEVKKWSEIVKEDAEKLNAAMAGFDGDNWRDVVPSVQQAAKELHSSTEWLGIEVNKLEDIVDSPSDGEPYDPR